MTGALLSLIRARRNGAPLPIGVDFGRATVRMLQVRVEASGDGARAHVHAADERPLPDDALGCDDPIARLRAAGPLLRQMLRQGAFHGRRATLCVPREAIAVKVTRLPGGEGDLRAAAELEAQALMPAEDGAAPHVDFVEAGQVRQGAETRREAILMAASRRRVDGFVEAVHRCGLVPAALDAEPVAFYRAAARFVRRRDDDGETIALLDLGERCAQVLMGRGRSLQFYRQLEFGGRALTAAVARRLDVSEADARTLRRSADLDADDVGRAVYDASRPILQELAGEVAMCLRYGAVTFRGARPRAVQLSGGEASDPTVLRVLAGALPVRPEPTRLAHNLAGHDALGRQRTPVAGWGLALGLALRFAPEALAAPAGATRAAQLEAADAAPPADASVPASWEVRVAA